MKSFGRLSLFLLPLLLITLKVCYAAETTTEKEVVEGLIVRNSSSTAEGSSSGATCSCDNSEAPVCASNGVTYKNSCRFDCSKKRVKRLRIVKNGACAGLTLNQYRGSSSRTTTTTRPTSRPAARPQSNFDSIFSSFFNNRRY